MVKDIKNIPEGIWILVVFSFAMAGLMVIGGLQMFSVYDSLQILGLGQLSGTALEGVSPPAFIGIGILLVGLGVLIYYVARGLLKAQNWSRVVTVVVSILGIIYSIVILTSAYYLTSVLGIMINGLIAWYLLFKDSTKKYFN
ncbi:MAG: hypothetical protein KKF50_04905 [Nanoarchaeota archaeon]|nr:hypothetical protein [Nanoarchaeota archaeon]